MASTSSKQIDLATAQLIKDLNKRIEELRATGSPRPRGPKPRPFADRFVEDLNGRRKPSAGYRAVYEMMMHEAGQPLQQHVKEHGFDLVAFSAVMKAYYSREGREARTSKKSKV